MQFDGRCSPERKLDSISDSISAGQAKYAGRTKFAVAGQRLGERGGCRVRLFRLFRIDDSDQKVLELGKQSLEHLGSLSPRQTGCEHFVGFGRDAEMTGCVPPREKNEQYAGENHEESITPAKIDQADEQSRKCH